MPKRPNWLDTTEEPYYLVRANEDVYSYFMFVVPTETKRFNGEFTWDIVMGYIVIALNFIMQGTLLYVVYNEVVVGNMEWQAGILTIRGGGLFEEAMGSAPTNECNDGGSLCFVDASGNFTCAPPTVQLSQRWEELDTNRDGIWSLDEAEQSREKLKCKYVVNPVEVFTVFQSVLLYHQDKIWLHPDVRSGKAIHKPYFDFALGDVLMCGYRNQDMCPNLLQRGYFHAPLKYGTSPRVGTTIDSALKYCRNLLDDGGFCEMTLPSTYRTWKIESGQQCGTPSYSKFAYTNPGPNGPTKSLLAVDYEARQAYELGKSGLFKTFKAVVLFLWLVSMLEDFRCVVCVLTWISNFPDAAMVEEAVIEEQDPSDPEDVRYKIEGITRSHRIAVGFFFVIRGIIAAVLTFVGTSFLLKQTDYIDLLLDGVALIFIVEISQTLYAQVLREEIKDQTGDIFPMKSKMYGIDFMNRRPALVDLVSLATILVIVYFVVKWDQETVVVPVYDALECTCLSSGDNCYETQKFGFDFWHKYWKDTVPGIFSAVAALKSGAPTVAFGAQGAAQAVKHSVVVDKPEFDVTMQSDKASHLAQVKDVKATPQQLSLKSMSKHKHDGHSYHPHPHHHDLFSHWIHQFR